MAFTEVTGVVVLSVLLSVTVFVFSTGVSACTVCWGAGFSVTTSTGSAGGATVMFSFTSAAGVVLRERAARVNCCRL